MEKMLAVSHQHTLFLFKTPDRTDAERIRLVVVVQVTVREVQVRRVVIVVLEGAPQTKHLYKGVIHEAEASQLMFINCSKEQSLYRF